MHKAVLIANSQTRNPPTVHVRMITIGNMDRTPATQRPLVLIVKPLQTVQVVQIPCDAAVFAIDFKSIEGLVATSVTG